MGLDIYAGTLTRYYSHNWKTVVQQWRRKTDTPLTGNHARLEKLPDNEEEMSQLRIHAAVENWRIRS